MLSNKKIGEWKLKDGIDPNTLLFKAFGKDFNKFAAFNQAIGFVVKNNRNNFNLIANGFIVYGIYLERNKLTESVKKEKEEINEVKEKPPVYTMFG